MIKLVIFIVVSVIVQQICCDKPERIVGGKRARINQFPYQVSIQENNHHICGGSIISPECILTAAHCVNNTLTLSIVSGTNNLTTGGEKHLIKYIRKHPGYTGESGFKHDIAVITLTAPIRINNSQAAIALANKNYSNGAKDGIVSGWGNTHINGPASTVLNYLTVNVLNQSSCLLVHKIPPTNENHICTLGKSGEGGCYGDGGDPLVVNRKLIGVLSRGLPCALGVPDVFTNVYKYRDFIKESCQSKCK